MDDLRIAAGLHGFSGGCIPGSSQAGFKTFSVGCFQWVPKSGGRGLKKSAVIYRISGRLIDADKVYARATEVCKLLNLGWVPEKKSERVI